MNAVFSSPSLRWVRLRGIGPEAVLQLLLGALLLWMAVALAADRSPLERQHLMRIWSICGSAIMIVAMPHVLFPQREFRRHLLTVPAAPQLLHGLLRQALPLLALAMMPVAVVAVAGGAALASTSAGLLLIGIWLLAAGRNARLGASSQGWQEGTRGGWYRRSLAYTSMPPALPDGSMPLMLTTTALFAAGLAAVVAWAYLDRTTALAALVPGALVLTAGIVDISRLRRRADREVFHTQAFFDEILRMYGGFRAEERPAASYESVYWAPRRLRPATWAHIVQMDRRAPLGRLVAAGHLFLWILIWNQGYDAAAVGYLLMFSLAKNMAPALIAGADASPPSFGLLMQPAPAWMWTRAFASLRWTLPWAVSLLIISMFARSVSPFEVLIWTILDIALAVAAAALITLLTEHRHRRALA